MGRRGRVLVVFGIAGAAAALVGCKHRTEHNAKERSSTTAVRVPQADPATASTAYRQYGVGYFPNVTLRTHENKPVRFYDDLLKGKTVVVNLFYSRCRGSCPKTMGNLIAVQKILHDRVGKDIFMYSISIKPEEDPPERLAEFARALGVGPGWYLLTGSPADIELVRRKLGYVDPDPKVDADKSSHVGMVRYGYEPKERWGATPGGGHPEWIAQCVLFVAPPIPGDDGTASMARLMR